MNDILVSIVMPVYNAAEFISDSIGDIIAQTYESWELICVNDGSTDNSAEVLSEFENKDKRILVITCENRGGGAARNTGFSESHGKYVLFLDADDRFENNLIELSVEKAEAEHADIVVYNGDKFDFTTGRVSSAPWLLFGMDRDPSENVFKITRPTVWNKLFLRSFLIDNGIYHQDERVTAFSLYFTAVAMLYATKISRLDVVMIHYRSDNPNSSLHKHDKQPLDTLNILIEIRKKLLNDGCYNAKKKIFLNFAINEIANRLNMFKSFNGYKELYEALRDYGFEKLDLITSDYLLEDDFLRDLKNRMVEMTIGEYLYDREEQYKRLGFLQDITYVLPQRIYDSVNVQPQEIIKLMLYGAGVVGRCYYAQITKKSYFSLVGWADRDYERYGYPIIAPEEINNIDYDIVLIAMENEATARSVKQSLISKGVHEEKIVWEHPRRYA